MHPCVAPPFGKLDGGRRIVERCYVAAIRNTNCKITHPSGRVAGDLPNYDLLGFTGPPKFPQARKSTSWRVNDKHIAREAPGNARERPGNARETSGSAWGRPGSARERPGAPGSARETPGNAR